MFESPTIAARRHQRRALAVCRLVSITAALASLPLRHRPARLAFTMRQTLPGFVVLPTGIVLLLLSGAE
jgi:hypothetical protein